MKWGGGGVSAKNLGKWGPKSKKGVLFFRRAAAKIFENGTRGAAAPRCWEGVFGIVFGLLCSIISLALRKFRLATGPKDNVAAREFISAVGGSMTLYA